MSDSRSVLDTFKAFDAVWSQLTDCGVYPQNEECKIAVIEASHLKSRIMHDYSLNRDRIAELTADLAKRIDALRAFVPTEDSKEARALVKGYTWDELTMEGEIEGFIEEDGNLVPCVVLDTRCWNWRGMPALVPTADQVVVKVSKGVRKVGQRRTYKPEIAKYEFRVFMKSIGLVGKEFKNTRTHLLNNLTGSSSKSERRVAA